MKGVMTLTENLMIIKDRIDSDYSDYKEEYAAEVAPQRIDYDYNDKDDKDVVKSSAAGSTAGLSLLRYLSYRYLHFQHYLVLFLFYSVFTLIIAELL